MTMSIYNEDDDVEDGDAMPVSPHLLQHSGLALVTQDVGSIVPTVAVLVMRSNGHALAVVCARCRWLAASRRKRGIDFS
jgi:hypothetical protein